MSIPLAREASCIFQYPESNYLAQLSDLQRHSQRLAPSAAESLSTFIGLLEGRSVDELREVYTRSFDLAPVCAPYLSVHLFGEGSFQRARLMTGLAELYAESGIPSGNELPDHVAVVLQALDQLDPTDQRDILTLCLRTALEKMRTELERQDNPYVLAITALQALVAAWIENAEVIHA